MPNNDTRNETRRSFLNKLGLSAAALTASRLLPGGLAGAAASTGKSWTKGMALDIQFTVATQASGRVKRPYVAVWIEDASGKTVRNLVVWVQQNRRNPRWLAELRRWTRENSGLLDTVSSATRNPGTYAVAWDGKNDKGTALPQGDYYVCVEAAREHGPYSLVREKVSIGSTSFKKTLTADNDIEAAHVSFNKA
ncbi:DUF2271 domain-containing protein [Deinococcus cavernae]|uniref:DUF2271 domain-containing protein n=1 Tax=Deinococcus cavernae TaxID=2320857 RepID=A0A418V4T5_9DEIO|nr:DUF2271 domain-containing protein [Deinococcus cavernae]RJF71099.1 DUF2271 domain-containing protein [Deinococcus cavernae]